MDEHERSLDQLDGLMLTARRLVDGLFAGEHPSPRHGPGIEFHDYRPYAPGDDPAAIDWRVYGRTDRLYLRRFEHHAELPVVLLLDASASMDWPTDPSPSSESNRTRHKLTHACELAAAVALVLARQGDPFGLTVWNGQQSEHLDAAAGTAQLDRLVPMLEAAKPSAAPDSVNSRTHEASVDAQAGLAGPFHALAGRLMRRTLVIGLSDWLDPPGPLLEAVARLGQAGHEVLALQLLSPAELDLKRLGQRSRRVRDPETAATRPIVPGRDAARYRAALDTHLATLRRGIIGAHGDYALLPTDHAPIANLRAILVARSTH